MTFNGTTAIKMAATTRQNKQAASKHTKEEDTHEKSTLKFLRIHRQKPFSFIAEFDDKDKNKIKQKAIKNPFKKTQKNS